MSGFSETRNEFRREFSADGPGRSRWGGGTVPAADTGEDAMLFAAFDWNQVLIAGAVGAAIGAVVYLFKRSAGSSPAGGG